MARETSPEAARSAIAGQTGALYRHGPGPNDRTFLCLATRLEKGLWATVNDRGAYGGEVYGQWRGTAQVIDLFLHTLEDDAVPGAPGRQELPVRWASQTAIRPVMLFGVPGDDQEGPTIAASSEMVFPEYQHIHRPMIDKHERFDGWFERAKVVLDFPPSAAPGSIFERPLMQYYRNGADTARDQLAICVHADMGYPGNIHLGGPVVDDFGLLVGVIIGADLGPERSHVGAYVPADFLSTPAALAKAGFAAFQAEGHGRHSHGIDIVEHQSNDIEWLDDVCRPLSLLRRDQLVKAVLPRRRWKALVDAATLATATISSTGEPIMEETPDLTTGLSQLREILDR